MKILRLLLLPLLIGLQGAWGASSNQKVVLEKNDSVEAGITACPAVEARSGLQAANYEKEIGASLSCNLPQAVKPCDKNVKRVLSFALGDSYFELSNRLRVDTLYGVNLTAINDKNNQQLVIAPNTMTPERDKVAYLGRWTDDFWFLYTFGKQSRDFDLVKFRLGIRNRFIFGAENSVFQTDKTLIKHVDSKLGEHNHSISRQLFWARESWLEFSLKDLFCTDKNHTVTMGIFPFSVGRGISLGDAYDIDIDFIGESTTQAVDQYAPGFKLSGTLIAPCKLLYDFYAEIYANNSENFTVINEALYGNQYGRRAWPQRGFGKFAYILAGRFLFKPFDEDGKRVTIEPYGVYGNASELKTRFQGDASIKLGTLGLAGEFEKGNFEFGFDTAFNIGRQDVKGTDGYDIDERSGEQAVVQSYIKEVCTGDPSLGKCDNPPATPVNKTCALSSPEDQDLNGKPIPPSSFCTGGQLYNSFTRFSNPYETKLSGGGMFVCDMAYNIKPTTIKVAATAGFATGDEAPNKNIFANDANITTQTYKGFISQQELYQGKRVKSLLFMAGQGRIPRPLSIPDTAPTIDNPYPQTIARFNNIILTGAGISSKPRIVCYDVNVSANVLGFWAWMPPSIPIVENKITVGHRIGGKYFGTEANVSFDTELYKDLKFFGQLALFIPGSLYKSISGLPVTKDLGDFSKVDVNVTNNPIENPMPNEPVHLPTIGTSLAYFVSFGFDYKF